MSPMPFDLASLHAHRNDGIFDLMEAKRTRSMGMTLVVYRILFALLPNSWLSCVEYQQI